MGNLRQAVKLLGAYSVNRFDIWALAGNSKASCRAQVMSALNGAKTPQAKSGINAITEKFYQLANITGTCGRDKEDKFIQFCKQIGD